MGNMLDIVNQEVYYVCNVFLICIERYGVQLAFFMQILHLQIH